MKCTCFVLLLVALPVLKAFFQGAPLPRLNAKFSPSTHISRPTNAVPRRKSSPLNQWKSFMRKADHTMESSGGEMSELYDDQLFEQIEAPRVLPDTPNSMELKHMRVPQFTIKTFPDGDRYEGEWMNGRKHGFGKHFYTSLNKTLEGEFDRGRLINGQGSLILKPSGYEYMGTWVNGLLEGAGKHISQDGFVYEGMFVMGLKCGQGRQVYPGRGEYVGEWANNVKHGQGKFTSTSGQVVQGEWRDDYMFSAEGSRTLKDGVTYSGTMVEGSWEGPGSLTSKDNVTYTGTFLQGVLNGPGTVRYPDGNLFRAEFRHGRLCKALEPYKEQSQYGDY